MNILIFSLGKKGFSTVKALVESSNLYNVHCVIGQDNDVTDDYSKEQIAYCEKRKITYTLRGHTVYNKDDFDIFLAIGWRWIINEIPEEKLIIFHDSLLPRYRGFSPLVNALINKEEITGVTALLGADEYDKGNILFQKSIDIVYPTNIEHEIGRLSIIYAELATELFEKLNNKEINCEGTLQDESKATYSLWRNEEDYRIDWNDDANSIEHFISCVGRPYLGASAILNGATVRVMKARVTTDIKIENRMPGKVVFIKNKLPVVVCGSGLLILEEVLDENGISVLPLMKFRSKFG